MPDWIKGSDACFLSFPEHFNTVTGPASRTCIEMLPLTEIQKISLCGRQSAIFRLFLSYNSRQDNDLSLVSMANTQLHLPVASSVLAFQSSVNFRLSNRQKLYFFTAVIITAACEQNNTRERREHL